MAQRPQELAIELEKIDQAITLTLQEIDSNFAKAHQIVTRSILPIVERYATESEAVWEGSKFWKQFFEASANVALSNYQEDTLAYGEETVTRAGEETEATARADERTDFNESAMSSPGHYESRVHQEHRAGNGGDDSLLDDSLLESLNITGGAMHSTPRPTKSPTQRWADIESPFEALKKELHGKNYGSDTPEEVPASRLRDHDESEVSTLPPPPTTPRSRLRTGAHDPSTPESSPLREAPTTSRRTPADPLMHRVLDKNWRLQATPLGKPAPSKYRTPRHRLFTDNDEDTEMSPPEPELQTQIFRTPGRGAKTVEYTYGEEDSDELILPPGFSPPKTMQFAIPSSKLLATPAREASRRIVKDILMTAGASVDESGMTGLESSPMRGGGMEDDDPF